MGSSMKDVAQYADVSTATVSHVINKTRKVNPETKEKVINAIKALNYNVNPVARNLRSGQSKMIGCVISNLSSFFFLDITLYIETILSKAGYYVTFMNSNENSKKERENIENLVRQNVDGLIIAPVSHNCAYMNDIIDNSCPCVFFDRRPYGFNRDVILSENISGGYTGAEYLIKAGYKKIGFVGSHTDDTMKERIQGYKEALRDYRVENGRDLTRCGSECSKSMNDLKTGECYNLAGELIENEKIDAILCGNDLAVVGVINYLKQESKLGSIGIVCFDDIFWLSIPTPPINAVDQDKKAISRKIATILLNRIRHNKGDYQEYRIPIHLVER